MRPEVQDPDLLVNWILDLRLPDAKQTQLRLKTSEGRCCLGVLIDTALRLGKIEGEWVPVPASESEDDAKRGTQKFVIKEPSPSTGVREECTESLPAELASLVGLFANGEPLFAQDQDDRVWPGLVLLGLADANDGGNTFSQIAQALEDVLVAGLPLEQYHDDEDDEDEL